MVEYHVSLGRSLQLRYRMRLSCLTSPWASIAPIPLAAVSTWTKNIFVKSGLCRTGGSHRCCFSCVKARLQSSVQSTGFLTVLVRVNVMLEKCGMKYLYHPTSPRKDRTAFLV